MAVSDHFYHALEVRENKFAEATGGMSLDNLSDYDIGLPIDLDTGETEWKSEMPWVRIDPPLPRVLKGKSNPMWRASILGKPAKMAAFGFSLPAGPPAHYGTCPASTHDINEPMFICGGCYALDGSYRYPSYILKAQVIREWTKKAVEQGVFAKCMKYVLNHAWNGASRAKQSSQGIWFGTKDYFRIHDSGDMWSPEYIDQWFEVANMFPGTLFWAPTRTWIFEKYASHFVNAPENFIARPSSLYFEDFPPMVRGLAAGSTASVEPVQEVWNCPVYTKGKKTCVEARCRTCWTRPDIPVRYPAHGKLARNMYKLKEEWAEKASMIHGPVAMPCFGCLGSIIEPGSPEDAVMDQLEDYDLE